MADDLDLARRVLQLEASLRELRFSLIALKVYVAAQATPGNLDAARAALQLIDQTAADLLGSDEDARAKHEELDVLRALNLLKKRGVTGEDS